ncbi:hypothetical protein PLESTM_000787300 [Pleodorina starrii]|nr:hypothetical protein PLESTM_000787300 [Pleodorina starrii]
MVTVPALLSSNVARNPMRLGHSCVAKFVCFAYNSGATRGMSGSGHRPPQVAVIGGGIAGAVCSHFLARRGAHVDVFDMGRQQPGGRASSRTPGGGGGGGPDVFQFDYGCQYFQARSPAMRQLLAEWLAAGVVAEWRPRVGVYDVARGALRSREELSPSEAAALAEGGLPPLPCPSSGPLYAGSPSMGALVAHLLRPEEGGAAEGAAEGAEEGAEGRPPPSPHQQQQQQQQGGEEAEGGGGGGIHLRLNTQVIGARWSNDRWQLTWQQAQRGRGGGAAAAAGGTAGGEGAAGGGGGGWYDALVLTDNQVVRPGAPGHIVFQDAGPALEALATRLTQLTRRPQFALMMGWTGAGAEAGAGAGAGAAGSAGRALPPRLPCDAMHVLGGNAVQWIAVDSSKPGRSRADGGQCWLALTRPDFAARLLAADAAAADAAGAGSSSPLPAGPEYRARRAAEIWTALQEELRHIPGLAALPPPAFLSAHRWSSCFTANPLGRPFESDDGSGGGGSGGRWAACGDFCTGPGLEPAAASGALAARAVADMLGLPERAPAAVNGGAAGGVGECGGAAPMSASDWSGAF